MVIQKAHPLAVVIGNGFVKARSGNKRRVFASVMTPEQGGIKFDGFSSSSDFVIVYGGQRYAIGESAYSLGRIHTVQMDRSRVGTEFYKTLFVAAMIATLPDGGDVSVIITLPLKWYDDREQVKKFLKERYEVKVGGKTVIYNVVNVRAVPEGFGVFCMNMLDDTGLMVDESFLTSSVGVIEIGTATTDLSFFDGLKINRAKSDGLPHGLASVWLGIGSDISQKLGRELDLHEVDQIIQAGGFKDFGEWKPIEPYTDVHMPSLASYISGQVGLRWGDSGREAGAIYVAGGGGPRIFPYLNYPHGTLMPKPWMTDVEGIYRHLLFKQAIELGLQEKRK